MTRSRTAALDAAREAVGGRDDTHGDPEDNFERIAAMWTAYLGVEISPYQVAVCMILLKVCRIASGHPDDDHFTDVCGYGTLAGHLVSRDTEDGLAELFDDIGGDDE